MKTLEQIYDNIADNPCGACLTFEEFKKAIKEWLIQKRQELDPNYSAMQAGYSEDIWDCAKADLIDKLLEEL